MNAEASVLCTTRHINFSVESGVRYFTCGPTISARASVTEKRHNKEEDELVGDWERLKKTSSSEWSAAAYRKRFVGWFFFCTLIRGTEEMKAINYELGIIAPGGYVVRTLFLMWRPIVLRENYVGFVWKARIYLEMVILAWSYIQSLTPSVGRGRGSKASLFIRQSTLSALIPYFVRGFVFQPSLPTSRRFVTEILIHNLLLPLCSVHHNGTRPLHCERDA